MGNLYRRLLFVGLIMLAVNGSYAEGTKEIAPSSSDPSTLLPNGSSTTFAGYDEADDFRLYIDIEDFTNETIYLGFQENQSGTIYYRIKDPSGTVVHGPTAIPGAGAGYINNHAEAVAGPSALVGGSGYNADSYTPSTNGSHYIEFNYNDANNPDNSTCYITLWDITVGDNTLTSAIPGRIHSKTWAFSALSYSVPFYSQFYIYTTDSIVTRLDVNGFQPYEFFINCNSFGVQNTGNFVVDRMSITSYATAPEYRIFLNDPDSTIYPTGNFATTLGSTPTIVGCDSAYCIQVDYSKSTTAQLVVDLNGTNGYQAGTEDLLYIKAVTQGSNCFYWDGNDGLGNPVSPNQNIRLESIVVSGLTNFPVWDAECNPNGFIVDVIRPSRPRPNLFYDDTNLGGGSNTTTGCVAPCHAWGASGGGCGAGSPGNNRLVNTYWFTSTNYISYLAFLPYCPPYSLNDTSSTIIGSPVVVDVLNNDSDPNNDIVNSSVSIAGSGPVSGTITNIDPVTGAITYSPSGSFSGIDSFSYIVCDGQSLCDTALVFITVYCAPSGGPENQISGTVFYDYFPSNGIMDGSDFGMPGVDINIYRDINNDGVLDGGDNLLTSVTTDGSGNYSYTPTDNLAEIRRRIQNSSDDAEQDYEGGNFGDMSLTSIDLDLSEGYTSGSSATVIGLRFLNIAIPPGANIDTASITFTARSNESGSTDLTFYSQTSANAPTFTSTDRDISDRTFNPTSVTWSNVPGWNDDNSYTSPDMSVLIQQVVDIGGWSSGNAIAFGIIGSDQEREAHSFDNEDNDTAKIPQLYIRYTDYPAGYIMEIDTNTAPAAYTLTTDNIEYSNFTGASQTSCQRSFGMFNASGFWPLAVKLIDFTAQRDQNRVQTKWEVASAIEVRKYIVERSSNGKDFFEVGTLVLDSLAKQSLEFEFWDNNPFNTIVSYYRLKLIDVDERTTISKVSEVEPMDPEFEFSKVYPTIINRSGDLYVELAYAEEFVEIEIFSVGGQSVFSQRHERADQKLIRLDLNLQSAGAYIVKVTGSNKTFNQSILVH